MMRGGPISMSEYMQDCLTSPQGGFYMGRDVFGRSGDFITSPEISQLFGEMVGIWAVHTWMLMGRPSRLMLVEMGPGRGTLVADLLRGTAAFRDFAAALEVHLVEVSPALRRLQWATLQCSPEPSGGPRSDSRSGPEQQQRQPQPQPAGLSSQQRDAEAAPAAGAAGCPAPPGGGDPAAGPWTGVCGLNGCKVFWHSSLDAVPDGPAPALYVAHEFFDALPVHQFVRDPARGWLEKMVDIDTESERPALLEADGGKRLLSPSDVDTVTAAEAGASATGSSTGGPTGPHPSDAMSPDVTATAAGTGARAAASVRADVDVQSNGNSRGNGDGSSTGSRPSFSPGPAHSISGSGLRLVLSPGPTPAAALLVPRRLAGLTREEADRTQAIEVSAVGMATAERLAQRIARHGGAALVVDYGREGPPYEDSLMAIRAHRGVGVLSDPGTADLSIWVDFGALRQAALGAEQRPAGSPTVITDRPAAAPRPGGSVVTTSGPVTQAAFLRALGIETRLQWLASRARSPAEAEALAAGCARLLGGAEEGGMGTSYQVMAIHHAGLKDIAGLSTPA